MKNPKRAKRIFTAIFCDRRTYAPQLARRLVGIGARDDLGCSPLFYAAHRGWLDVMAALLHAGAIVDARDNDGETALMWAAEAGETAAVDALVKAGAAVNAVSPEGYTALIWAANCGRTETIHALLSAGPDIEAMDRWGQTAQSKALGDRHAEAVDILLAAGARIVPTTGMLIAAAYGGFPDAVRRLVELGVDVNAVDQTGSTALTWAREGGNDEVAQLLLRAGAR